MLKARVLTALIGIPAIIALIWFGMLPFLIFINIFVIIAVKEIINMFQKNKIKIFIIPTYFFSIVIILQTYFYNDYYISDIVFIFLIFLCFCVILKKSSMESITFSLFIILYIPFLTRYLLLLRAEKNGFILLLALFLLTWAYDTGAYFIGKRFGRIKLNEKISPKKTVEGLVGGLIFTVVIAILIGEFYINLNILYSIVLGIIISFSGQIGDLFESQIKRKSKIKDSGNILPGHGGVLDRIDSLLFSTPIFYYLTNIFRVLS
jgi:phosphatidate cytidylyltransferase